MERNSMTIRETRGEDNGFAVSFNGTPETNVSDIEALVDEVRKYFTSFRSEMTPINTDNGDEGAAVPAVDPGIVEAVEKSLDDPNVGIEVAVEPSSGDVFADLNVEAPDEGQDSQDAPATDPAKTTEA